MDTAQISAFENFLSYGPIGLAGLMLVLVIFALLLSDMSEARSSLLKFFMVIGGLCFAAVLSAQFFERDSEHNMRVNVLPTNLHTRAHAAPPALLVNGQSFDPSQAHVVAQDFVVIIDLSEGLSSAEAALNAAKATLESTKSDLEARHEAALDALEEAHAQAIEALEVQMTAEVAERDGTISFVTTELEKVRAIQASLSDLQSDAPSLEILRISKQMNREFDGFMRNMDMAFSDPVDK